MRELRLAAVSADGGHLVLAGHGDEEFTLRVDDRLRAALHGDRARLGHLDIQLESQLRPRDIQARVRAGESVDDLAAVAGMPREKVERFAAPVIAEREHIAGRARQAMVRRLGGDAPPQTLEATATAAASSHGADLHALEWDAWRRDDGRWLVRFCWPGEDAQSAPLFSFDPSGRTVVPENDEARALAGEIKPTVEEVEPAEPDEVPAGPARLSVVAAPEPDEAADDPADPLDLSDLPTERPIRDLMREIPADPSAEPEHTTTPLPVVGRRPRRGQRHGRDDRRRREPELWTEEPADSGEGDAEATSERLRLSDIASRIETEEPAKEAAGQSGQAGPARKPPARSSRSRRPSVPSWDEIMFGRRKTTES